MASLGEDGLKKASVGRGKVKHADAMEGENVAGKSNVSATGELATAPLSSRFRFFIIDTGWKSSSAKVIRDNFAMIRQHQEEGDALYVLSKEQSLCLVKKHPDMIGKDPIIMVHDLRAHDYHAHEGGDDDYHGFRLNLGIITDGEIALDALQRFLRFVSLHRRSCDIERDIQDKLHRDGMKGLIEILRSGSKDVMGG